MDLYEFETSLIYTENSGQLGLLVRLSQNKKPENVTFMFHTCLPVCTCGGQRAACGSWFPSSSMSPGVKSGR